jgi:hypothetical protein
MRMKVLSMAVALCVAVTIFADDADTLAQEIEREVKRVTAGALALCEKSHSERNLPDADLVRTDVWKERWPDAAGVIQTHTVTGELWTAAIQKTIDRANTVYIPARKQPYYLDNPIVLKSGQSLVAATNAVFRLQPNVITCMIRNEHVVGSTNGKIPADVAYDHNIVIEGGVWTTLGTSSKEWNGNNRGHTSRTNWVHGCHGVILLNHVDGVVVRNVTIRQSRIYGIHISDTRHFLVENICFEENGRDGIHVNGNSSFGIIRGVQGSTHDDFVALNAWEWMNVAPVYGDIHHVLVEDVWGTGSSSSHYANPLPDGSAEIRLLPGTRTFADGKKVYCDIHDCVLRRLVNIRTVKAYDQPNLERGRDNDFCDPIGTLRNIFFRQMTFSRPGHFQIAANVDGFSIRDVQFDMKLPEKFRLVEIGPMSGTYKGSSKDPSRWVELFSPDSDITVKGFRLENVLVSQGDRRVPLENAMQRLVKITDQRLNPDYPKTTPRGGTGKVIYQP